jgi:uncharacterized protein (DUF952 family)
MSSVQDSNRVLKKYYVGVPEVFLVHIRTRDLTDLRYEAISNGDIYPHQYGTLVFARDVEKVETLSNV